MKRPLVFTFLFCFAIQAFSQACAVSTDTAHLDVNNARVILQAGADMFWNRGDGYAGYVNPKGNTAPSGIPNIATTGFWLGGLDDGGNLKLAASMYGAYQGQTDWWPGPLDMEGTTNSAICTNFDQLWKVNHDEILSHIADFTSDGDIDGPVPQSILAWPGKDNPESMSANGFALPAAQTLAPFVDRNGNGKYEPNLGDYPKIKGDQAIWWIFNDEGGGSIHYESNSIPNRAEVHAMAYAFEGSGDENLANTSFYEFTIFNRAAENMNDLYTSLWLTSHFGCPVDDFFGCISEEKMAIFYNEDEEDGQIGCDCGGAPSFCDNIPVTGIKVLSGPKNDNGEDTGFSSFIYFNNPGLLNPPIATTDPATDIEFYNYQRGTWRDGTPLTLGGSGYNPSGGSPHPFALDGNPAEADGWSSCTTTLPQYDRRLLINSGPVNLSPGESTSICYAVMTKFGVNYPCPDVTPLIEMGNAIEEFCASLSPANEPIAAANATQFYPNPLVSEGKLTASGEQIESVRLFNVNGQLVRHYKDLKANELIISRGGLPAGLYYYATLLGNGQLATRKIAIQ
ncbi:MAG: T9SS type A sorting domain-containing protein [Saprospiraceae bacterium]|nr:T9SS type A sorting domain-containing protein [Saprospiraceae bacterium]